MKKYLSILVFTLIFACAAFVQTSNAQGVVFKIPEDVFPMDWNKSGFKGILMLRKDSPSGIFVGYPNEDETIEALKTRAAKFILPMIVGQGKKMSEEEIKFQISSIPNRKGDSGKAGQYYSYKNEKSEAQIIFYERTAKGSKFIYGYFALKNESMKDIWADDKGQGVEIFEKFWKSIKE